MSLLGAVYGTLLVNAAKTIFSEDFPQLWLFAMGALFIGVVLAFPDGVAGLYRSYLERYVDRLTGLFSGGSGPRPPEMIAARAASRPK